MWSRAPCCFLFFIPHLMSRGQCPPQLLCCASELTLHLPPFEFFSQIFGRATDVHEWTHKAEEHVSVLVAQCSEDAELKIPPARCNASHSFLLTAAQMTQTLAFLFLALCIDYSFTFLGVVYIFLSDGDF